MGRFLSLVDKEDDVAGSCTDTFRRFGEDNVTEQIFDTGDGHGLFYQPKDISQVIFKLDTIIQNRTVFR